MVYTPGWVSQVGESVYGRKNLWKRCVLIFEQKRVGMMDGESGDDGACLDDGW